MKNNTKFYNVIILLLILAVVIINLNTRSLDYNQEFSYTYNDLENELRLSENNIVDFINTNDKKYLVNAFESFNNASSIYPSVINDSNIQNKTLETTYFRQFMDLFVDELRLNFHYEDLGYWEDFLEDIKTFKNFVLGENIDKFKNISTLLDSDVVNDFRILDLSSLIEHRDVHK